MNGAMFAAVGLSLVSAVAYATAAVAQERLAARSEPKTGLLTLLGRGASVVVGRSERGRPRCCMSSRSPTARSPWSSRWAP